jgi:ATP-dependent Clp protease ATP-binding subunit ClpX
MPEKAVAKDQINCNFCGKTRKEVNKLIVANDAGICNECIDLCNNILNTSTKTDSPKYDSDRFNPETIKEYLDQFVIGQDAAKRALSVAVVNHFKRISNITDVILDKSNIMVLGPTGSGKTLMAKTLAKYLDLPIVIADATTLTEAGYVGQDVDSVISNLFVAANYDVERCQRGIIFLDEVDKIGRKGDEGSNTRDVSGEGVQQALLKLVEGTKCKIYPPAGNRKFNVYDQIEIDTSNILFIASGAFVGLDAVISNRTNSISIGFNANVDKTLKDPTVIPTDLIKFGLIPEFCGRFPVLIHTNELQLPDYLAILTDVKNSVIEQSKVYFDIDQVQLEFTTDALEEIAAQAHKLGLGARGLKTITERILMPIMYQLPKIRAQGHKNIKINAGTVKYNTDPIYA